MKKLSLFAMAFAAMAFTACSQDDDLDGQANKELKEGELVEAISINFGEAKLNTRAYAGTEKGEGTEGRIYEAFIFAKEANPSHTRAKTGDYTVIRVTANPGTGQLITETGGVDEAEFEKSALTKAINESATADVEWLVENVATFHGVRQGDYVYVIANDPSLTLAQASEKAHQGENSEAMIKDYVAALNKDYLNGLVYRPEYVVGGKGELPSGKFFMAGREMIPVSPTIPSNGVFALNIGLDRELAKVNFKASVSTSTADAACDNVVFKEDDGIVVARISRKTSPFVNQENGDWYVPSITNKEDWPINNHALVNGVYSSFCDATMEGARVFDGTSTTPITDWVTGTTIPASFNATAPAADVTEYRYSWKIKSDNAKDVKDPANYVYVQSGTLYAPMFYTTPNYSNNTNSVTVICTQATYVGRGIFSLSDMADKYVDAALATTTKTIPVYTKEEVKTLDAGADASLLAGGLTLPNPLMQKCDDGATWADDDILDKVKEAINTWGVRVVDATTYGTPAADSKLNGVTHEQYLKMMDRFYVAVMLHQRLENKMNSVAGSKKTSGGNPTTEEDWGNGIDDTATAAYLANEKNSATDSLLVGWKEETLDGKKVVKINPFYISLKHTQDFINSTVASAFIAKLPAGSQEAKGTNTRATFFDKVDAYEYFKGQKVYYRADVADYVGGVSNKLTERNVYYNTTGTIQSLGAKSIHDAIYADNNTMSIHVTVRDWRLSMNQVPM